LKLVAKELSGTPLHVGVVGTLLHTTPWGIPVPFLNHTVPGAVSSTCGGTQQFA
jgi:hypothetical protein